MEVHDREHQDTLPPGKLVTGKIPAPNFAESFPGKGSYATAGCRCGPDQSSSSG